ncbi:hypothetical protein IE81DRAFT_321654 [Ceraceosorus guamensis]|uniref:COP9 signalosome complex subunit 3 N-terminal helical repeats domain-containing protein n=1 Tax=Ceraceosorus guamensis TaxID=1522189 RepID=A0A316W8J1_9BASI|nr:hypothetical protein IE81DRAFT_321654 [Ceraceosorus guamensis]PWN44005.1 hypothetical protein IE81DRAFT_321654 [Ceraceosorus guamensis]
MQTPDDALTLSRQLVNSDSANDDPNVIADASGTKTLAESLDRLYKKGKGEGAMQLTQPLADGRDPLSVVVYPRDTLVGLYILNARLSLIKDQQAIGAVTVYIDALLARAPPELLRMAPNRVTHLARQIATFSATLRNPQWGLQRLLRLHSMSPYEVTVDVLTPLHAIVLYQALKTGDLGAIGALVEVPVQHVAKHPNNRYLDALEYFYYAGLAYLKLDRLDAAANAFETCLSVPAREVSAIQLDAYKKLILVQLMLYGKTRSPPKHVSPPFQKILRNAGSSTGTHPSTLVAYETLARLYARGPVLNLAGQAQAARHVDRGLADLQEFVAAKKADFAADANWHFVQSLLGLHRLRRIQRLGDTFGSLTIADIIDLLALPTPSGNRDQVAQQVAADLLWIAQQGWSQATIDGDSTPSPESVVVHYHPASSAQTAGSMNRDAGTVRRLQAMHSELHHLSSAVEQKERTIATSASYLLKVQHNTRPAYQGGGNLGGAGMDFDDYDEDVFGA